MCVFMGMYYILYYKQSFHWGVHDSARACMHVRAQTWSREQFFAHAEGTAHLFNFNILNTEQLLRKDTAITRMKS